MEYMEMLARLGIGSAHPGGFAATVKQLKDHPIPPGSRVLEVGCGTGRTSCYLARQGVQVTALDLRDDMLAKARRRATAEKAAVAFVQGSITDLPFPDDSFDIVLAESVTIFADIPLALREYRRVLRPEGRLYDREIIAIKKLPAEAKQAIRGFYRVEHLYKEAEWRAMMRQAGFRSQKVIGVASFPISSWDDLVYYPDLQQESDPDAYGNESIWETARTYDSLMAAYSSYLGFGLMQGIK